MIYIILITILIIVCCTCIYIIWNLLGKLEIMEKHNSKLLANQEKLEADIIKHYDFFIGIFSRAQIELERVDKRGAYSSKDEVGFAFKVIKTAIEEVKANLEAVKASDELKPNI